MIDRKLINMINSGRCFVLVGSGPSCEMGYPTWANLAEHIYKQIQLLLPNYDKKTYDKYISDKKYAEMFSKAEDDLGERKKLLKLLQEKFDSIIKKDGDIYHILSRWPFSCYLTTNYDDEIDNHLKDKDIKFLTIQNTKESFYHIRDNAKNIIQKLHSDLHHPDDVIVTSRDYSRLYTTDESSYFREKLKQIFVFFDIVIIGHSLYDIDINHALQIAKKAASPYHPIYMFIADATNGEIREYYDKYNINIIPYNTNRGKHDELIKLLRTLNNFIVPRDKTHLYIDESNKLPNSDAASALFLHRNSMHSTLKSGLAYLILYCLYIDGDRDGTKKEDILNNNYIQSILLHKSDVGKYIDNGIFALENEGFIHVEKDIIRIKEKGKEEIGSLQALRIKNKEIAYHDFINTIKDKLPELSEKLQKNLLDLAEKALAILYEKRGIVLANSVFAGAPARPHELSDIFDYIYNTAQAIECNEIRYAFIDAMYKFSIEPTDTQLDYLASISQGFFLYHAIGLNPEFQNEVIKILQENLWIYDSNVIIPLLAQGSTGHSFAKDFIRLMNENNSIIYTTYNIAREVFKHFIWSYEFIKNNNTSSIEFLKAATLKSNYKQNLFIDGYIQECTRGSIVNFNDYTQLCFNTSFVTFDTILDLIKNHGICLIDKYSDSLIGRVANLEDVKKIIREEREKRSSYRSEKQVETDAELIAIIDEFNKNGLPFECEKDVKRIYVLTQGKLYEKIIQNGPQKVWPPEQLYRFLLSVSNNRNNPVSIWEGMLSEYYNIGFPYINKSNYNKFFGQQIDQSRLSFEIEKEKYISEIDGENIEKLDNEFINTEDLEKPLFVEHMGWKIADEQKRKADLFQAKLAAAEAQVRTLEEEKSFAWKKRQKIQQTQMEAEKRNAQNPRHIAKRHRQAKKRKKKR